MEWLTLFLSSSVIAGTVGAVSGNLSARSRVRESRYVAFLDDARRQLHELRGQYVNPTCSDLELPAIEVAFDGAIAFCNLPKAVQAANAYKVVGRSFRSRDPDVGREDEAIAYTKLADILRDRARKFDPR